MRLLRAIIAAFLSLSVAIIPISMPRAAGMNLTGHHGPSAAPAHEHHQHHETDAAQACDHQGPSRGFACHQHADADATDDGACCGSMACHFFQVSAAPNIYVALARSVSLAVSSERVSPTFPGRLDRPPRTV